jgi:hypothetical protein
MANFFFILWIFYIRSRHNVLAEIVIVEFQEQKMLLQKNELFSREILISHQNIIEIFFNDENCFIVGSMYPQYQKLQISIFLLKSYQIKNLLQVDLFSYLLQL